MLHLVPDPSPECRAAHLRVLIHNATDTFGPDHKIVVELRDKLEDALAALRQKRKGPVTV